MKLPRRLRIEREVELVLPAELEARAADRIIAQTGGGMAFREVGRVGRDAAGAQNDVAIEGMAAMAEKFRERGGEIYVDVKG